MALTPGTRLGPYEIVAAIGAGGMGEVYRAKDTKLNRDVALKILPEAFTSDADRLARFRREAQVLASLNHPNIAAIYGMEGDGPGLPPGEARPLALVMELVEGRDLSEIIAAGSEDPALHRARGIPLSDALPIAKQIADAIEAAHEQGVVHRDLKPANIKVRNDGTVKVLDFGLAKALDANASSATAEPMNSPTMTARATQMGMIIGTAAYMAPEQAKGKTVDKRADIWAFGVVLYEMLTGRRAFEGEDISTTLAAVLMREPEWIALPANTPPAVVMLLRRCLERDPKLRLRDIGEARLLLSNPQTMSGSPVNGPSDPVAAKPRSRAGMVVAALTLAAVTGLGAWWLKPAPPVTSVVMRFQHPLPEGQQFTRTGRHIVAISPDGSKIAYVANEQLYLRDIGQLEAQPIRGTQEDPLEPVFSPDNQSIAYFAVSSDGGTALRRVAVSGGAPMTLCTVKAVPSGMSWRNGLIAYGQRTGIEIVPDSGGAAPRTVVTVDATQRAVQPQLLDDGQHVLFTLIAGNATSDEGQVVIQSLDGASRIEVMKGGSNAQVLPTGHLIFIHNGTLFAMRFDAKRQAVTGGPVPIVEGVSEVAATWAGNFSVSLDGSLVYRPGVFSGNKRSPAWLDRQGHEQATTIPFRDHAMPRLSPDGKKILVTSSEGENDVWVWDVASETPTRLTFGPAVDAFAIWMPDSRRVIFSSTDGGRTDIYRRMADGTGELEPLTKNGTGGEPESVSPDSKFLVYRTGDPTTNTADLRLLPLDGTGQSRALLADPKYNEFGGDVSPDGRWIAYQSNETKKNAIYVRPFPNVDGFKRTVSAEGGTQNRWSRSGRELFYVTWPRLYKVAITPGDAFVYGRPELVVDSLQYSFGPYGFGTATGYDVAADGRFLFMKSQGTGTSAINALVVVTHWFDELKARMNSK